MRLYQRRIHCNGIVAAAIFAFLLVYVSPVNDLIQPQSLQAATMKEKVFGALEVDFLVNMKMNQ